MRRRVKKNCVDRFNNRANNIKNKKGFKEIGLTQVYGKLSKGENLKENDPNSGAKRGEKDPQT